MVEERKDWKRFYISTRKEDLVYLVKEILSAVKSLSYCEKLKIPKSGNTRKKGLAKLKEEGKIRTKDIWHLIITIGGLKANNIYCALSDGLSKKKFASFSLENPLD
jgi:hypothetical protein